MNYESAFKKGFIGSENKYKEFISLLALNEESIPEEYFVDKVILDDEVCKNIELTLDLDVDQNIVIRTDLNSKTGKLYKLFLNNGYNGTHSRRDFISFTPIASYSFTRGTSDDIILGELSTGAFFTNIHYSEETKIIVVNTYDKETHIATDLYKLQEPLSGKLVIYTKIPMDSLTGSIEIVKFPYYVESDYELAVVDGFRGTEADFIASGSSSQNMNIVFRVENKNLQISYDGGTSWVDLYDLGSLQGKSAYELAVEHGFVGTEEEWVKSLEPVHGKSAYHIAVEYGFAGTAEEWLEYLRCGGDSSGSSWPGISSLSDNAIEDRNGIYLSKSLLGGGGGPVPEIGPNGNWVINGVDSGKPSRGEDGISPHIGSNGNWFLGEQDLGVPASGGSGGSSEEIIDKIIDLEYRVSFLEQSNPSDYGTLE